MSSCRAVGPAPLLLYGPDDVHLGILFIAHAGCPGPLGLISSSHSQSPLHMLARQSAPSDSDGCLTEFGLRPMSWPRPGYLRLTSSRPPGALQGGLITAPPLTRTGANYSWHRIREAYGVAPFIVGWCVGGRGPESRLDYSDSICTVSNQWATGSGSGHSLPSEAARADWSVTLRCHSWAVMVSMSDWLIHPPVRNTA
jgi:hypothetical protein